MTVTAKHGYQSGPTLTPDTPVTVTQTADAKTPAQAKSAPTATPAPSDPRSTGKRHILALDGMRGIAVLLVLCFHFRLGPFRGGFVGVTVFFTLSGFLICSRTLTEVGRSGSFAVRDFFERRVRRLAPAAIVCILAVVVFTERAAVRTSSENQCLVTRSPRC